MQAETSRLLFTGSLQPFLHGLYSKRIAYFLPLGNPKVQNAIMEAFRLLQWYAIHHTLACVVPAMFIAGAISTFLSQASVMRYLGADANRVTAYGVASVAGIVLAVCSCSVLPMFAGIYAMGAGLGPASAFLYSGPAINVMAVFLSARVLGFDIGLARALGAVVFAVVIGLLMAVIFRRSEQQGVAAAKLPDAPTSGRPLWKMILYFLSMILFLVFSDWYNTNDVSIVLKDGTRISANVRYDRQNSIDIQKYQADGSLSPKTIRIPKSNISKVVPVPGVTQTIYSIKRARPSPCFWRARPSPCRASWSSTKSSGGRRPSFFVCSRWVCPPSWVSCLEC